MIKVAIMGYGTIGSGVCEVLEENQKQIADYVGQEIQVKYILDLRDFPGTAIENKVIHDFSVIAEDQEIQIVVETMGGLNPAYPFVKSCLEAGKHVVTSNKALVAAHGTELLVLTERKTRKEIIMLLKEHTAAAVVKALDRLERRLGAKFREIFKSITVDNGSEFADYEGMKRSRRGKKDRTRIYYCHPYSSWERGSNENQNKLVRRHIPKGTDFDDKTQREVEKIEEWINNYPRRIFDYRTSEQLFEEELRKAA